MRAFRIALFIAAAALMWFGAATYTLVVVPDLHGDLVEIGVRPTVLGGTVIHLYFAAFAMFGFAAMVSAAAIQAVRRGEPAPLPLAIVAVTYIGFGAMAFGRSHNPHHLGPVVMGVLLAAALMIPASTGSPSERQLPSGMADG
jgi:hypothetical protein